MTALQNFRLMAEYNRWMNARMYDAAATLPAAELLADKGAFFGSLLGTLNHLAVADTIWLHRLVPHAASPGTIATMSGLPRPTSLRQALADDLASLRAYRDELDALILRWVAEVTPDHLSSTLTYRSTTGVESTRNFGALLQHFFNHQTHHRGQTSTLLFQAGVDVGVTDLLALIPDSHA